ncbi:MAG: dockerin type I domain-containing protein [Clostridia bacterium]|nr:dockerin type I domain-containing protein [Clostridia bacterium]
MWAGDVIADAAINMSDIVQHITYFNSAAGDGKYNADADFDKDGAINMTDILIIIAHFNSSAANYPTNDYKVIFTDIPQPTTPPPTIAPTNTPTPTPDTGVKEWSPDNVAYKTGDKVTFQGSTYECTFPHSSNSAWTPVAAGTLWKKI